VKGTKLWQAAGSPIIQGRSRRQRPSWQQWLPAWVAALAFVAGLVYLAPATSSGSPWAVASGVLGALLGAVVGVEVTRAMGWRFPFLWGAVLGVCGAAVLLVAGTMLLPT
jgi:predicted MFS family arabinose efflux permease